MYTRNCFLCKKEFVSQHPNAKYCSRVCRSHVSAVNYRKKYKTPGSTSFVEQQCVICSRLFKRTTAQPNKKYCSPECAKTAIDRRGAGDQWLIFNRDSCRCIYCGSTPAEDDVKLVLDHIVPVKHGGTHTASNLVTSCCRCNASKSAKALTEETLEYVRGAVSLRNKKCDIDPLKTIKGSHEQGR